MSRAWPGCVAAALILLQALAGCSSGRNFARPLPDALSLGQVTAAQITAQYGAPFETATLANADRPIKILFYLYAERSPTQRIKNHRYLNFYLWQDTLIGYEYSSTFKDERSDVDVALLDKVIKGRSTREHVLALLGEPTGRFVYPMTKKEHAYAISYAYTQNVSGKPMKTMVIFSLNRQNVVVDIAFRAVQGGS